MTSRNKKILIFLSLAIFCFLVLPIGVEAADPAPVATGGQAPWFLGWATDTINATAIYIGWIIEYIASRVLYIAAMFFNLSMDYSILRFSEFANMKAIGIMWEVSRNLCNIFFIFIMLYIGIGTMLELGGVDWKKMTVAVISAALLINFSSVIVKTFFIDPTNVIAAEFHQKLQVDGGDLAAKFMDALDLRTLLNANGPVQGVKSGTLKADEVTRLNAYKNQLQREQLSFSQIILNTAGGTVFILITAFTFFAGAALLMFRSLALLFLIILSPFAFLLSALPGQNQYSDKFWKTLTNQALVAPVYLFMIYFASKVVIDTGGGLRGAIGSNTNASLLDPFRAGDASTVYYFLLANGLMMGAIIAAQELGAVGSAQAISIGQRATTWTTGKVFGAAQTGYRVAASPFSATANLLSGGRVGTSATDTLKEVRAGVSDVSKGIYKTGAGIVTGGLDIISKPGDYIQSGARYVSGIAKEVGGQKAVDIFTSEADLKKDEDKRIADAVKATGKDKTGYEFLSLQSSDQKDVLEKLSARDRVALEEKIKTNYAGKIGQYEDAFKKLSEEEKDKTNKTKKEVEDKKAEDAGRSAFAESRKDVGKFKKNPDGTTSTTEVENPADPKDIKFSEVKKKLDELPEANRAKFYGKLTAGQQVEILEKHESVAAILTARTTGSNAETDPEKLKQLKAELEAVKEITALIKKAKDNLSEDDKLKQDKFKSQKIDEASKLEGAERKRAQRERNRAAAETLNALAAKPDVDRTTADDDNISAAIRGGVPSLVESLSPEVRSKKHVARNYDLLQLEHLAGLSGEDALSGNEKRDIISALRDTAVPADILAGVEANDAQKTLDNLMATPILGRRLGLHIPNPPPVPPAI